MTNADNVVPAETLPTSDRYVEYWQGHIASAVFWSNSRTSCEFSPPFRPHYLGTFCRFLPLALVGAQNRDCTHDRSPSIKLRARLVALHEKNGAVSFAQCDRSSAEQPL